MLGSRLHSIGDGGLSGNCPLHDDRNPSFSIHPVRGWKCFTGCGEGKLTELVQQESPELFESEPELIRETGSLLRCAAMDFTDKLLKLQDGKY